MQQERRMNPFVDSGDMTDREVQRLGWADDPRPSQYNIQAQIRRGRSAKPTETWTAQTVWAAAATAHRINLGEYLREPVYQVDTTGLSNGVVLKQRNRTVMSEALKDTTLITDQDRELGDRARAYHGQNLTFRSLKGTLREFEVSLQRALALETFTGRDGLELALIASQIRAYEQAVQLEAAMEGISREPLADIGAKVDVSITVVKSVWSQNYNVFFVTAVTEDRHAVFFSYREQLGNGHQCRLRGTVKSHRENSTQLNRVRMV